MVVWDVARRARGSVLYRDTSLGGSELDAAVALTASSLAPFNSGSGTTICVHVSSDFTKAVFVWPATSDQLYEMSGGSASLILGGSGLSLDGDVPGQIAIGSGAHLWTGDTGGNLNRYSYPGLSFEASITATATNYGLAADGSDTLYWWNYSGGNALLQKRTLAGTQTTIATESDVGERRGIGFNPYDGLIYEYLDLGGPSSELRSINPSTGTATSLTTVAGAAGSLQPCFTPDGGVWLLKRVNSSTRDVYRWDIPGASLATSTAAAPAASTALVPLL